MDSLKTGEFVVNVQIEMAQGRSSPNFSNDPLTTPAPQE
jgi:hypothetical protein